MSKLRKTSSGGVIFQCPGCNGYHSLAIRRPPPDEVHASWEFNGNFDKPTFNPSIFSWWDKGPGTPRSVCHSFVRDGMIQFLSDCTHALAGKTVEIPDWPHAAGEFWGIEE